jgi:hypothetical protein
MTVKDDFAGKTGKCPVCGTPIAVPQAAAMAGRSAMVHPAPSAPPSQPRPVAPPPVQQVPAEPMPIPIDDIPPMMGDAPQAPSEPKIPFLKTPEILFLAGSIALTLLLAFTPLMPWISLSTKSGGIEVSKTISGMKYAGIGTGVSMMIFSLLIAAVAGAGLAFALAQPLERRLNQLLCLQTVTVVCVWGHLCLWWVLAWIVKTLMGNGSMFGTTFTAIPHLGLWFALLASAGIGVLTSMLLLRQLPIGWLKRTHIVAAALGSIMLIFYVQPWNFLDLGTASRLMKLFREI